MTTSVALPAFELGHDPSKRIIVASYGTELAIKLTNDFRMVIGSPSYRRLFPLMRSPALKDTELEVVTSQNDFAWGPRSMGALWEEAAILSLLMIHSNRPTRSMK
jgi:hypothetical protein